MRGPLTQKRHDHLSEPAALFEMRVPGQDERADPQCLVRSQLRGDLLRVADDRDSNPAPRKPDARPQILLDDERRCCRGERLLSALSFTVDARTRLDEP